MAATKFHTTPEGMQTLEAAANLLTSRDPSCAETPNNSRDKCPRGWKGHSQDRKVWTGESHGPSDTKTIQIILHLPDRFL